MNFREKFEKETGQHALYHDKWEPTDEPHRFTDKYVIWLEKKLSEHIIPTHEEIMELSKEKALKYLRKIDIIDENDNIKWGGSIYTK